MVRSPGIEMVMELAKSQHIEGPLSIRVERILETLRDRLPEHGIHPQPTAIRTRQAPPNMSGWESAPSSVWPSRPHCFGSRAHRSQPPSNSPV